MLLDCRVFVDVSAGQVPGELTATVLFVLAGGGRVGQLGPYPIGAGKGFGFGPIQVTLDLGGLQGNAPAAQPVQPAGTVSGQNRPPGR